MLGLAGQSVQCIGPPKQPHSFGWYYALIFSSITAIYTIFKAKALLAATMHWLALQSMQYILLPKQPGSFGRAYALVIRSVSTAYTTTKAPFWP